VKNPLRMFLLFLTNYKKRSLYIPTDTLEVIMNKEKMIADELQHMFLEGKLKGFEEEI